jgi:uncharacterized membrane protein YedE/YeeE
MDIDLKTWGPLTVLAVIAVVIVLLGGAVDVVVNQAYTFHAYLDDLKWIAGALAGGAAVGRGIRLHGTAPAARRRARG